MPEETSPAEEFIAREEGAARLHSMRRYVMLVAAALAAVGVAFSSGWLTASSRNRPVNRSGRRIMYYIDPMHPAYRSEKPGKAPDCGMDLEPVYADTRSMDRQETNGEGVYLTDKEQEAVQVQTETLQLTRGEHLIRTVGRVVPDETLTSAVSAGVDGWVRREYGDSTGTEVVKGQKLASFYSKDLSAPQQAFVYALESYNQLTRTPSPGAQQLALASRQLATARENLQYVGMGDEQIEQLGRSGGEISEIALTAPADGRILERNVAVGQRFMRGDVLYRIADLRRVWVLTDVLPSDVAWARSVRSAEIRVEGLRPFPGQAAEVPLRFNDRSRIGSLRIVADNPDGTLVPGMLVEVMLHAASDPALTLRADAVIDSGTSKRVFVAAGDGWYESRPVETGWREADRVEIRSGLREGERVVTAGTFLLDSESRLSNWARGYRRKDAAADRPLDPVCGMKLELAQARRIVRGAATYYFCSETCQRKFEARPFN